jgi:hypothetical protein
MFCYGAWPNAWSPHQPSPRWNLLGGGKAKCNEKQLLHLEKHEKIVENQAYCLKSSIH